MSWPTHEVTNQVPPLQDINLYTTDLALGKAVDETGHAGAAGRLSDLGRRLGSAEMLALGDEANRHPPQLRLFDRGGHRIDSVDFHPSWHALLSLLREGGLHADAWLRPAPDGHLLRAAAYYLHGQVEAGSLCPTTMTFASVPVLQKETALFAELEPRLASTVHDPRDLPLSEKTSMLIGMGMTEKQGGSDVRSNTTHARPEAREGRGEPYLITGHKWFFSAPMCDAHLVLARTAKGLSCFYVPRWRPDGTRNTVLIQQMKDKLGNRSNSSSEVEFQDAWGLMVGEEGRGIPTIIEMAGVTRVDCVIGSAALMRHALVQAIHHARHRNAFGQSLVTQPLMRNVLADLALESEAATLLMLRLASSLDRADAAMERVWRRVLTPAAKFWVCKRALEFTGECMEVWGGNGYVETGPMARLYREAPVNSIWEGSGNIMCLDVLRAIEREPEGFGEMLVHLRESAAQYAPLQQLLQRITAAPVQDAEAMQAQARRFTQDLVLLVQADLMLRLAPSPVAESFVASRVDPSCGRVFGSLLGSPAQQAIIERAWPL